MVATVPSPPIDLMITQMFFLLFVTVVLAVSSGIASASPAFGRRDRYGSNRTEVGQWVDAWASMPQLTEYTNLPPPPFVSLTSRYSGSSDQVEPNRIDLQQLNHTPDSTYVNRWRHHPSPVLQRLQ